MSRPPVVAIVGAPNVGKSTLVNRILRRRKAVVSETPGTTRDRTYQRAEWAGREFTLVDTGGMEPAAKVGLEALVTLQARIAAEEADVVVHLTDARLGVTEVDAAIARVLREASGEVVLAVNKLDDPADDSDRYRFYALGEGEPYGISAEHGLGVGDLLDEIVARLPEAGAGAEVRAPRIAIVGRPNVGKSTLLNRLLDAERAVVSEAAGTTTDAIETELVLGEERYVLLDTAGVGRRAKREAGVPYYAALRTYEAIRRSDVSLLLVDAREGVVGGDLQIAREIAEARRAFGVLVNKRDLVTPGRLREIEGQVAYRMTDLKPKLLGISALTGRGVDRVIPFAADLYRAFNLRLGTHEVAEFVSSVVGRSAPPGGVKIRYATQTGQAPPVFTLFATRPADIPESYVRYLENAFRERYDLHGVSLGIRLKSSR
ncbi:ribosome biogenesis GTPase Der [Rubrobacter taiwanensis]|jgi:GTP-binding protein|uniref:GTPase Der n=1 Tax=Rubrobacter taiwanensis TaxID=185139 RepID=A0A4R1BHB0_9ACTN|nr:ribosome biogenesis GTPase Der [Rubrobacter taiwanensis]TCJ16609.1 ribosome biogenesis GTPase Der [Rubrobacter taiwanensis]